MNDFAVREARKTRNITLSFAIVLIGLAVICMSSIVLFISFLIIGILFGITAAINQSSLKSAIDKFERKKRWVEKYNIPQNAPLAPAASVNDLLKFNENYYMWTTSEKIMFIDFDSERLLSFPINSLVYFTCLGEKETIGQIGNYSDTTYTPLGRVQLSNVVKDNRTTVLKFLNNEEEIMLSLKFGYAYEYLCDNLPQKEKSIVKTLERKTKVEPPFMNTSAKIAFNLTGVTFPNNDGISRQKYLEQLQWSNPPFDKKLKYEIIISEYNGSPAMAVFCNDIQLGWVPKEKVEDLVSKWNYLSNNISVEIVGGVKSDNEAPISYGAKISLHYKPYEKEPFRKSNSDNIVSEDEVYYDYEFLKNKIENCSNSRLESKVFTLIKNSTKTLQENVELLYEEQELYWFFDIEEGQYIAKNDMDDLGFFPESANIYLDEYEICGIYVESLDYTDNGKMNVRVRIFYKR